MSKKWQRGLQRTIPELIQGAADKWPDKNYLDFSGQKFTFLEVEREATRIANGLSLLGLAPGDRVCVILNNSADNIFTWFAVCMLGGIIVPINTELKGDFLIHTINDSDPVFVVVENEYVSRLAAIEEELTLSLTKIIVSGDALNIKTRRTILSLDSIRSCHFTRIISQCKPEDIAALMYTSGTTGRSKGCMLSHNQLCNSAHHMMADMLLSPGDVLWTPLPLFHIAALCLVALSTLSAGAVASIFPRFSPSKFWPEIERSGGNKVVMVGAMLSLIADDQDSEVSKRCYGQLEAVVGAPFPDRLKEKWKDRFGVRHTSICAYGMSEVFPVVSVQIDKENQPDCCIGRVHEDLDVRLLNNAGEECNVGEIGEFVVRPNRPNIMFTGYWRRPEETLSCFKNLWFHTGDLGRMDENGYFFFADRKKDSIRKRGENISSFELEMAFMKHPDIEEVAAYAVPSEISEDELKITVVVKKGSVLTEEALCMWSIDRLPRFAVPRFIDFRSEIPKTPSGKMQKYKLRDTDATIPSWDREKAGVVIPKR